MARKPAKTKKAASSGGRKAAAGKGKKRVIDPFPGPPFGRRRNKPGG